MVMKLYSSGCKAKDRKILAVDPEIHVMLSAFAKRNNLGIATATNLLLARAMANELGGPLPPLKNQIAELVLKTNSQK